MFKILKNFSKRNTLLAIACVVAIVIQVWLDLKLPDYMSQITILVETEGSAINDIIINGAYMLGCALGSLLSAVLVGYMASLIASSFSRDLRTKLFSQVESFGMKEIKQFSTSSLITRTTNDITQVEMFISMGLQALIKAPIMATWAITKILNKGLEWSIATAVAVAILIFIATLLILIAVPKFKIVQKLTDRINEITRENLIGIRVVHAFNAEDYQAKKFEVANKEFTDLHLFTHRMMAIMSPGMNLIMHGLVLSIYIIGAYLINAANMLDKITLFSNMVVFSSYGMQVIMAFVLLAVIFVIYPRASVSASRINEVLDTKTDIKDGHVKDGVSDIKVEFKHVSFKYPDADEYVLKDVSFKAKAGETIAFIGSTGSGKSTLINLVMRFYDATSGQILIDGVDIKDYELEALYNKIGYVPQKAIIFNDSVKNNVSYGNKTIAPKKITKAIEVAQASDFVQAMPNGENTNIAQGGTNISGDQKQRIAIARAIAREPDIYVFDDAFSALDYKTDALLRKELKAYTSQVTNLIVAQRIGTILNADQIIVLDKGTCVGLGNHQYLMKHCAVYKEIAISQLSKEELANA